MGHFQFRWGFAFQGYGGQFRVTRKNLVKSQSGVREITGRNRGVSFAQRCDELRRHFQGWVGYYRLVPIKSFFSGQDHWVRRRIWMCIWKSWKTSRTGVAALMKLGIPEDAAYNHGMSSKGPWVLSFSPAVHQALSTALLEERGLPSLSVIWTKLTAKNRTA